MMKPFLYYQILISRIRSNFWQRFMALSILSLPIPPPPTPLPLWALDKNLTFSFHKVANAPLWGSWSIQNPHGGAVRIVQMPCIKS